MLLTWGWAISIMVLPEMNGLARIKLDDQLLLYGLVHIVASRLRDVLRGHLLLIQREPRRERFLLARVERILDPVDIFALFLDRDHIADAHGIRRDVHDPAVDRHVPMRNELPGIAPRGGEADPVDDVIQPRLQQAEQVEAGDAGHLRGPIEVETELTLQQEVDAASPLLRPQLDPIVGDLAAPDLGMHARRHRPPVEGAFREALLPLEEEFHALAAAMTADRAFVTGH